MTTANDLAREFNAWTPDRKEPRMDAQVVYERHPGGDLQHGPCEFVRVGVRFGNRVFWIESAYFPGSSNELYQKGVEFACDLAARWNELEPTRPGTAASRISLISDLSCALTDEGADWSNDGLDSLRRRTAEALPDPTCPDWLRQYRSDES